MSTNIVQSSNQWIQVRDGIYNELIGSSLHDYCYASIRVKQLIIQEQERMSLLLGCASNNKKSG